MKKLAILGMTAVTAAMFLPVGGRSKPPHEPSPKVEAMDLSSFPKTAPKAGLRLLFIHHSCGGHLFADPGEKAGTDCIYKSHPNGGGLRSSLKAEGYEIHEASYRSEVGDRTDIFDWPTKFRTSMDKVLTCDQQNTYYSGGRRNHIVVFKSCYPNNEFIGRGTEPGKAEGPELTLANAKAAYASLLPEFTKQPDVLFVCMTAPPLVATLPDEPLWKATMRAVLNRPRTLSQSGSLAREFNNWLKAKEGWLAGYARKNVVVFDHYDILTGESASNYAAYPSGGGTDSHPSQAGNAKSAKAFITFLNQAVHRFHIQNSK